MAMRYITYHALDTSDTSDQGNSGKQLGRLLLRYQALGLVIERRYATGGEISRLGILGDRAQYGRPKIWESVPAAAGRLFGTGR